MVAALSCENPDSSRHQPSGDVSGEPARERQIYIILSRDVPAAILGCDGKLDLDGVPWGMYEVGGILERQISDGELRPYYDYGRLIRVKKGAKFRFLTPEEILPIAKGGCSTLYSHQLQILEGEYTSASLAHHRAVADPSVCEYCASSRGGRLLAGTVVAVGDSQVSAELRLAGLE